jgi:diphthamide biosynthesis protein 3
MGSEAPYEEVALSAMAYDEAQELYTYECPCGDLFSISCDELAAGEDIAHCASCSLVLRVLLDADAFADEWAARKAARPPPEAQPAPQPVPVA